MTNVSWVAYGQDIYQPKLVISTNLFLSVYSIFHSNYAIYWSIRNSYASLQIKYTQFSTAIIGQFLKRLVGYDNLVSIYDSLVSIYDNLVCFYGDFTMRIFFPSS